MSTNLSRRAILAGAASTPALALPAAINDAPDLHLLNAVTDMQAADAAIDWLHKQHGDDADGRDDYHAVEAKRDVALDILADQPARTPRGMVAKAEVLSERCLIEDYTRHGEIATSLAADVLRHFAGRMA
jgi:hypothetical protein